ncbi:aminodeoxychorismate lyase [Sinimarinibacterium thermocellulolyticum]|uniref:Aminodeoxychorismate lyase n=1 Tax=Sinimarinibacterium thermocellulolyticum TaxID=3170016 RepID=A0ABV2AE55_9GAMM
MNPAVLHDGRPCTAQSAHSRALHYGDGVFRTMLWRDAAVVDWPLHRDKLFADCAALRLEPPTEREVLDDLQRVAAGEQMQVLKLIVARRAQRRGYAPQTRASERWVFAYPVPAVQAADYRSGIVAAVSEVTLSEQVLLAGVKHLNRLDQVLAADGWAQEIGEALMRRGDGAVICGTRSNLFVVRSGVLLTPTLDRCGVAGIMRRKILDCARGMNIPIRETELLLSDVLSADEAFVCNALIGIWPLRRLQTREWSAPGALTRRLMHATAHPLVLEHLR